MQRNSDTLELIKRVKFLPLQLRISETSLLHIVSFHQIGISRYVSFIKKRFVSIWVNISTRSTGLVQGKDLNL